MYTLVNQIQIANLKIVFPGAERTGMQHQSFKGGGPPISDSIGYDKLTVETFGFFGLIPSVEFPAQFFQFAPPPGEFPWNVFSRSPACPSREFPRSAFFFVPMPQLGEFLC